MKSEQKKKSLNTRSFVGLVIAFSGLGLPLTGVANHFYGFSWTMERHAWMSAHNALGVLFVVFAIWHIVLNRRALWNHVRGTVAWIPGVSRELALASALVAVMLLLSVGHALHVGQ